MSNQGKVQAAVRTRHGQAGNRDYNGDWLELFAQEGITVGGTYNGLLLTWLNAEMAGADPQITYTTLNGAQAAYAASQGAYNWNSMVTINAAPPE